MVTNITNPLFVGVISSWSHWTRLISQFPSHDSRLVTVFLFRDLIGSIENKVYLLQVVFFTGRTGIKLCYLITHSLPFHFVTKNRIGYLIVPTQVLQKAST